jgi:hypothetical protein
MEVFHRFFSFSPAAFVDRKCGAGYTKNKFNYKKLLASGICLDSACALSVIASQCQLSQGESQAAKRRRLPSCQGLSLWESWRVSA